jgi:hypothetical protein
MSGYCEHKKQYSSHNYDVSLGTDVGTKKQILLEFDSLHGKVKEEKSQFFIYVCDCFSDLRKSNKKFTVQLRSQIVEPTLKKYSYSPSFKVLSTRILPIAFVFYACLLGFVLFVTKTEI